MHELSVMQALFGEIDRIACSHGAQRAVRVVVEVGAISNVVPELLERAYEAFRDAEPLLHDSQLEIRCVPLVLRCRECGESSERGDGRFQCPLCRSVEVDVVRGEELLLRDIELEV